MIKNMGFFDRVLRTMAALVVGILYLAGTISGLTAAILGAVALIFLATSAIGTCPAYMPFGFSTRRGQRAGA